ncbi:MAG: hypothetical protein OXH59_10820 [Rhodospirillaceae bacterium]|nr:hypothetical protein [Rhodospirillaceae bacterium]
MQDSRNGHGIGAFHGHVADDSPGSWAGTGSGPEARIEDAVMRLGRQIAREQFARPKSANDNAPTGEAGER